MEELLRSLETYHPPSPSLQNYLRKNATIINIARKQILLQAGKSFMPLSYIQKGLIRRYHLSGKKEICSHFFKEGNILLANIEKQKTLSTYQAIEPTQIILLSTPAGKKNLYAQFPELNIIARKILCTDIQDSNVICNILRFKKAKERYEAFAEYNPALLLRIPSRYLATYLNVSEGTISRIRGRKY